MLQKPISIGVDIGGTHITCSAVDLVSGKMVPDTLFRETYNHENAADLIFRSWATALNHTLLKIEEADLAGIGFAIPGPFDYRNGISKMQHKFEHLFNIHIPTVLNELLISEKDLSMRFLNDATSFAIGEAWQGDGKAFQKVVVITLGTGFGSAFLNKCIPVVSGEEVPKEGCLWHLPFKNGMADDYFSTRWFLNNYREKSKEKIAGVKEIAEKAETDTLARNLFTQFGQNLAECLTPWLQQFSAEVLIVGGNIAHTLPLFEVAFKQGINKAGISIPVVPSRLMETAALLGSARLMEDVFWEKVSLELPLI